MTRLKWVAVCGVLMLGSAAMGASTSGTKEKKEENRLEAMKTTRSLVAGKVKGVQFKADITYLDPQREEKLDLYLPTDREPGVKSPAIVMIHGGGWIGGKKDAAREIGMGTAFAEAGFVAVSAEYLKTRHESWSTNVQDCKNAVRWLRANAEELQVDPERIGVIGGSAGGHLALMVAYTAGVDELEPESPYPGVSSEVKAAVNLYGITNLMTRQKTDKEGKPNGVRVDNTAMFAESKEEAPEKWKLASPVNHIKPDSPPTLIMHGAKDTTVDRDQAYELAEKLKEAGVAHELLIFPEAGHSFRPYSSSLPRDYMPYVVEWFRDELGGEKTR